MARFAFFTDLAAAATLLTRLPLRVDHAAIGARGARAGWAYPLVGLAIGAAGGIAYVGLSALRAPEGVCAAAALGLMALLTGALHEDGLADFADGVGGGRDRAHALEIMKDSSVGAFGALALLLATLLRWSALAAMSPISGFFALVGVAAFSRGLLPMAMLFAPDARGTGLAASVGAPPRATAATAVLLGALILASTGLWLGWTTLFAGVFAILAAIWILRIAVVKLGGRTGDVLGAAQQAAEVAALVLLSLGR